MPANNNEKDERNSQNNQESVEGPSQEGLPFDSETPLEDVVQSNLELLEQLAQSELPISSDAQRALQLGGAEKEQ